MTQTIRGFCFAIWIIISGMSGQAQQLENQLDSLSYIFGYNLAENIKRQGIREVDHEWIARGVADAMANKEGLISRRAGEVYLKTFVDSLRAQQIRQVKAEGEKFLADNAKRKGVVVLPSGLQYEVLKSGKGPKPKATDKVVTHYHGTLINGTVFDSSVNRGEPITFGLNQVIKGWQEALQLMSVGDKWKLFIPYQLAYGEKGSGGIIPGYSALIFEVELLEIKTNE